MTSPEKDSPETPSPNSDCELWSGFERAWNSHKAMSVASYFDADARLYFYDGRSLSGHSAIVSFYRGAFANMPDDLAHMTTRFIEVTPTFHTGELAIKQAKDEATIIALRFFLQLSPSGKISVLTLRSQVPVVHLLHGLPGTGKSTFARQLADKTGAVCLNHDEWMIALYGNNPPAEHFADYHDHVLGLIWRMAAEFAQRNIDVILDHGFWTRMARDQARKQSVEIGAAPLLYTMDCPPEVADSRVLRRNQTLGKSALYIDQAALDTFRTRYEPLGADENHISIRSHN